MFLPNYSEIKRKRYQFGSLYMFARSNEAPKLLKSEIISMVT